MNRSILKDIDRKTTEFERKKGRIAKKMRKIAILIGVVIAGALCFMAFYNISRWYDENKVSFYFPLKFIKPIVITQRQIKNPVLTTAQIKEYEKRKANESKQSLIERIYQKTRQFESNFGFDQADMSATHVYCQSIGKVNEIGYFYKGDKQFCFNNEADQRKEFTYWLNSRINDGYTLNEAFCEYVTGTKQPTCKRAIDMGL